MKIDLNGADGPRKLYCDIQPTPGFAEKIFCTWVLKDDEGQVTSSACTEHKEEIDAIHEIAEVFCSTLLDGRIRVVIENPDIRDKVFDVIYLEQTLIQTDWSIVP